MKTLVIATDAASSALVDLAPGDVRVLAVGCDLPAGASGRRLALPSATPAEAAARDVVDAVRTQAPDVVLGGATASDRVLLGAVAGALGCTIITRAFSMDADGAVTWRAHGGLVERTSRPVGTVVVSFESGTHDAAAVTPPRPQGGEEVAGATIRVVEERPHETPRADLAAARRVVGVGSGLRAASDLVLIRRLADALGAEIACTRPLAQLRGWLPADSYVGTSGRRIAPELYVAVGISGQLQHTLGVRGAGTIVVINSDASAPFIAECDHAIVGDLYAVVPALIEALRG